MSTELPESRNKIARILFDQVADSFNIDREALWLRSKETCLKDADAVLAAITADRSAREGEAVAWAVDTLSDPDIFATEAAAWAACTGGQAPIPLYTAPADRGVAEWQPIETAPKDKPIILGLAPTEDFPEGYSSQGHWQEGWEDSVDDMGCNDGFVDCLHQFFSPPRRFGNPKYQSEGVQPSRWMPLPAAPQPTPKADE